MIEAKMKEKAVLKILEENYA